MGIKEGDKLIIEVGAIADLKFGLRYIKDIPGCFSDKNLEKLEKYNETEAYKKGLNDAWEAARKIGAGRFAGKIDTGHILNFTATEALDKIKAHEEKKKAEEQKKHLCGSCIYEIAECKARPSDVTFGKYSDAVLKCPWHTKNDEIRVGDEVQHKSKPELTLIVTAVKKTPEGKAISGVANCTTGYICDYGDIYENRDIWNWEKTGKHYDEIEKLFGKSGEDND